MTSASRSRAGNKPRKKTGKRLWLRRWLLYPLLVLLLISAAPVLALRWLDPPTSAFMLAYRWDHGRSPSQVWRDLERISPRLPLAVLAAEDQRFPTHLGFDLDAINQAIADSQQTGRLRGASTITQQTAKNLFLWAGRNFVRKGLEAWYAVLLEALLPKQRILEIYLNIAEFGEGVYGAEAAARRYFNRGADALTARQAALLAARLPNPAEYQISPPSDYMEQRVGWILEQIDQLGGEAFLQQLD